MATTSTDGKGLRGGTEATTRTPAPKPARASANIAGKIRKVAATCCSSRWTDDVLMGRTAYPPAGMQLSRCRVSTGGPLNNKGEVGTRRWTPRQNVSLEDMLDGLSINQARAYHHPGAIVYGDRWTHGEASYDPTRQHMPDIVPTVYRVKAWPVKRRSVRVRARGRVLGFEEWCEFPEELTVEVLIAQVP